MKKSQLAILAIEAVCAIGDRVDRYYISLIIAIGRSIVVQKCNPHRAYIHRDTPTLQQPINYNNCRLQEDFVKGTVYYAVREYHGAYYYCLMIA